MRDTELKDRLNNYLVLLRCAKDLYNIKEEAKVVAQITAISENIKLSYKANKLRNKTLDTIKLYINNLRTDDLSIILPEGKVLLQILK